MFHKRNQWGHVCTEIMLDIRRFSGYIYSRLQVMRTGVGFEVYTVMWIQIVVLWAAVPCSMLAV
jgi:hypothetical protein